MNGKNKSPAPNGGKTGGQAPPSPDDLGIEVPLNFRTNPPGTRDTNPWVQQVRLRIEQLSDVSDVLTIASDLERFSNHLRAASEALDQRPRFHRPGPTAMGAALSRVHAAEELLLRKGGSEYFFGQLPAIQSDVEKYLAPEDPIRVRFENMLRDRAIGQTHQPRLPMRRTHSASMSLDGEMRGIVTAASEAAHSAYRREYAQLRSFRNVLLVTAFALALIALGIGIWGVLRPDKLSLCFYPESLNKVVCPTGEQAVSTHLSPTDEGFPRPVQPSDIFLVQFIGLIAAAVSGAISLRRVSGTSTPYSLNATLAVIKLPAGALSAFLGLILMRGGFIPGLSALDNSAQILAWAAVFGAAQQLVTGLIDQQAESILKRLSGNQSVAP